MNLSNLHWLGIVLGVVILVVGILLFRWFKYKFAKMDGFEGFITERGKRPRRADFDWAKSELERLKQEASQKH